MQTLSQVRELVTLYSGFSFSEIEEMFQIAQADLVEVKTRARQGLASPGELRDVRADFAAIRGLKNRIDQQGRI